jgi:hypothetical protein
MRHAIGLSILLCMYGAAARMAETPRQRITTDQATALVMASLTAEQRRLPKVEAVPDATSESSKFLFFTVIWEGTPKGSVVVANYAVDPYTADVFSAVTECTEEKNKRLLSLQKQVRATLHLSQSEYLRSKTKGPLCEK